MSLQFGLSLHKGLLSKKKLIKNGATNCPAPTGAMAHLEWFGMVQYFVTHDLQLLDLTP